MRATGIVVLAFGALGVALGGCSGFDRLDFQYKSAPPDNEVVTYDAIQIHDGIVVGVTARPMDGNDVMGNDTRVELTSQNPSVFGVGQAVQDASAGKNDANWNFVFYGVSVGSTTVIVRIDGETKGQIPATVAPQ